MNPEAQQKKQIKRQRLHNNYQPHGGGFKHLRARMDVYQNANTNPIFLETSRFNLEMMKNDQENEPFSAYYNKDMHGHSQGIDFIEPLGGRGQSGFGGFIGQPGNPSQQHLVKIDDSATCILEGSAKFAQGLIPKRNKKSVNFASAGVMKVDESLNVISVQPRVSPSNSDNSIVPWDKVVYGQKRNPKTWVSAELKNKNKITGSIDAMSDKARSDLASAIYISNIVGDESLHVGQFMAEVDDSNKVVGITRIDFGARERYSATRFDKADFKDKTSNEYRFSGQAGKDYISYLLANPDVKQKYLSLCARDIEPKAIARHHARVFQNELQKLPIQAQHEALDDILNVVFKKSGVKKNNQKLLAIKNLPLAKKRARVATILGQVTEKRVETLQKNAQQKLYQQVKGLFKKANNKLDTKGKSLIRDLVSKSNHETVDNLKQLNQFLSQQVFETNRKNAKHYHKIANIILQRQAIELDYDMPKEEKLALKEQLLELQQNSLRMAMLNQLSNYKDHLKGKFVKSDAKKSAIKQAINKLRAKDHNGNFAYEPKDIFDEKFKTSISKRRINPEKQEKSHGQILCTNLTKLTRAEKTIGDRKLKVANALDELQQQEQQESHVKHAFV
jgi:hypothetical protein